METKELLIIQELSARLITAQQQIRILDLIKWDDTIKAEFFRQKEQALPAVTQDYYLTTPLPFDIQGKLEEFSAIWRDTQNQLGQYSAVARLIRRQCNEYSRAVHMLAARGTPTFCEISMELYGSPHDAFYAGGPRLSELGTVLSDVLQNLDVQLQSEADVKKYTAIETQEILQKLLSSFFQEHPDKITVTVNDQMVADASAGADSIKLNSNIKFSERDIKYLEVHEGWVHLGTTFNGAMQPYCSFLSKGCPSTSVIQEGLAVITEVVTFSSYPGRVRKITNRVIALEMVRNGADFLDIYHYFLTCGFNKEQSYNQSVRIFRGSVPNGGAFTKDLSYAKGFLLIYNFLRFIISQRRIDIIPLLFVGKLTLDDLPLLQELRERELLIPPVYLPSPFRDLAALSAWLTFSLFLNKFSLNEIQKNFRFLLA